MLGPPPLQPLPVVSVLPEQLLLRTQLLLRQLLADASLLLAGALLVALLLVWVRLRVLLRALVLRALLLRPQVCVRRLLFSVLQCNRVRVSIVRPPIRFGARAALSIEPRRHRLQGGAEHPRGAPAHRHLADPGGFARDGDTAPGLRKPPCHQATIACGHVRLRAEPHQDAGAQVPALRSASEPPGPHEYGERLGGHVTRRHGRVRAAGDSSVVSDRQLESRPALFGPPARRESVRASGEDGASGEVGSKLQDRAEQPSPHRTEGQIRAADSIGTAAQDRAEQSSPHRAEGQIPAADSIGAPVQVGAADASDP